VQLLQLQLLQQLSQSVQLQAPPWQQPLQQPPKLLLLLLKWLLVCLLLVHCMLQPR
jgi:hypothetical protein